jgi:hypothetical protein
MATQGVDGLRALPDQQLPDAEDHRRPLDIFALHGNKTHRWANRSFTNGLGICRIVRKRCSDHTLMA